MLKRKKEYEKDEKGNILMNAFNLRLICEKEELYEYPELNEKLYLHFKGFRKIENLEPYFNIKTLWLENNCLTKIENLSFATSLISLFLHHNLITSIENLDELSNLRILNLSYNRLKTIENLSKLTKLEHLDLSYNQLMTVESIQGLKECPSLTNINLTNNLIEKSNGILEVFEALPLLACLYLKNNEFIREFSNYRKNFVAKLKNLQYLDDRPVFKDERRLCNGWLEGGKDRENEIRKEIAEEKMNSQRNFMKETQERKEEIKKNRKRLFEKAQQDHMIEKERLILMLEKAKKENKSEGWINCIERDIETEVNRINDLQETIDGLGIEGDENSKKIEKEEKLIRDKKIEEIKIKEKIENNENIKNNENNENNENNVNNENNENNENIENIENNVNIENNKNNENNENIEKKDKVEKIEKNIENINENNDNFNINEDNFENKELDINPISSDLTQKIFNENINKENTIEPKENKIKWDPEFDSLLELLLEKNVFDFKKTCKDLNKRIKEIWDKLGKTNFVDFEEKFLRERWTLVERTIRKKSKEKEEDLKKKEEDMKPSLDLETLD